MTNIFTAVDVQTNEVDNLEAVAQKFGVTLTPETEKIVRAKAESDNFIEQIKRENEELRKRTQSQATVEEIMTQIKALAPRPNSEQQPPQAPQPPATGTPDDLEKVISDLLNKKTSEERINKNRQIVEEKVLEKWGADAQLNINKKAKELGVTVDYLQKVALDSPSIFFTLTGLNSQNPSPPPVVAPRGRETVQLPSTGKRDKAFYDGLKARDFNSYISPKVQNQMMKDALELGESFWG